MYHSPHPSEGREKAGESAAKVALESLGLIQGKGFKQGRRGRGRGNRGRGHQGGHQGGPQGHQNQYQPWAEYSGHYAGLKSRQDVKRFV